MAQPETITRSWVCKLISSAGYSGVAVEDGDTLLDNTISIMNELAYVLDDGQMSPFNIGCGELTENSVKQNDCNYVT